ncbi:cbb3-type cytochrome c oxidase subunit I, partial [Corynebacterium diphtheriae]|uniref:cbb3-type cytochrome c oxidase subunit I n=1 Tax=Corynebacterium diphtheriae TaxID=1717 RepID=UPI000D49AB00
RRQRLKRKTSSYNEALGRIGAVLVFIGFNATFLPQFVMGSRGMPRRYYNLTLLHHTEPPRLCKIPKAEIIIKKTRRGGGGGGRG